VVEMVHCKASDELMLIIIIDRVLIASFAIISQSIKNINGMNINHYSFMATRFYPD
jgi:hypothetical protein